MAKLKKNSEDWFTTESGEFVVVPLRVSGEARENDKTIKYFTFYTTSAVPSTRIEWEGKFAVLNSDMAEFLVKQKYARKAMEADFPKVETGGKAKKAEPVEAPAETTTETIEPQPEVVESEEPEITS